MADNANKAMSPWHPISDPVDLKHLGKLQEELGELTAIVARIIIQGMDERNPDTGAINRDQLEKEVADVYANLQLVEQRFKLNGQAITHRAYDKAQRLREWHAMA